MTCFGEEAFKIDNGNTINSVIKDQSCVKIPSFITAITGGSPSSYAFQESQNTLLSVDFSAATKLERIGSFSFYLCSKVITFDLSACSSLSTIGECAFQNCYAAKSIYLPNSTLKTIPGGCFYACKALKTMQIPSNVEVIASLYKEYGVFGGCSALDNITFLEDSKLLTLGTKAFISSGLKTIKIPASLISISPYTFRICNSLQSIEVAEGNSKFKSRDGLLLTHLDELVYFPSKASTNETVYLPSYIKSLGSNCFIGVSTYKYLILNDQIQILKTCVFYDFLSLINITIPYTVTIVSSEVFNRCKALKNITFLNQMTEIPPLFAYLCSSLETFRIPQGVTKVCKEAFSGCTQLHTVYVPVSVVQFESGVFQSCAPNLTLVFEEGSDVKYFDGFLYNREMSKIITYIGQKTEIVVISSVNIIGIGAFKGKTSIKRITFENSDNITMIESSAFSSCTSLEQISLPERITILNENIFFSCSNLKSVNIPKYVDTISANAFQECTLLETVSFASGSLLMVDSYAFETCIRLSNIRLPDSVQSINDYAFYGCSALATFYIPLALRTIGEYSFSNTGIVNISFETSVVISSFARFSFYRCLSLKELKIPDSIRSIFDNSFSCCYSIKKITIGSNTAFLDKYAFSSCTSLEKVSIPNNTYLTTIDPLSFSLCPNLVMFDVNNQINNFYFEYGILFNEEKSEVLVFLPATLVQTILIPSSVTRISAYAFSESLSIRKVIFQGNGIAHIGIGAFKQCSNLMQINFPSSLVTIGSFAFYNCSLSSVTLSMTQIRTFESNIFSCNSRLIRVVLPSNLSYAATNSLERINSRVSIFYFGMNEISNEVGLNRKAKVFCFDDYPSNVFFGKTVTHENRMVCTHTQSKRISNLIFVFISLTRQ